MKKLVIAIVVLLALGFAVYSNLGGAVKKIIETAGTEALGTKVSVSGLAVSLSNMTASMSGLSVANPKGFRESDILKAKSISATLGGIADKTVTIKEIVVDGMTVTYELGPNGANFDALRKNIKSTPAESTGGKSSGKAGGGYDVVITKLRIVNAEVIPAISGLSKPVKLPEIVVSNIGSKSNPATPTQVAAQVMDRILATSSAVVLKSGLSSALPAGANVDKAKGALKGLLGK